MAWWNDVWENGIDWSEKHTERFHDFNNRLADVGSYSDFVGLANEFTDGWYGTVADAIPFASNLHRAVLNRDRVDDILDNTGKSWSDVIGYNSNALTGGTSASLAGLKGKIEDGKHDLFEFYTGEKDRARLPHRRGF